MCKLNALQTKASVYLIALAALLFSPYPHAHLLNMTEAQLSIENDGHARLVIQIDASSGFENREQYFNASQIGDPLGSDAINALLARIYASIEIHVSSQGNINILSEREFWNTERLTFLENKKLAYFDLLSWPKIEIVARSKRPLVGDSLSVKFKTDFIFEEPISLTLISPAQGHPKTRWLIAYQQSPVIALNTDALARISTKQYAGEQKITFYFLQGLKHVLPFGFDHLLFVAALAFAFLARKALAIMLSVFTFAHCITLLVSVYGLVRLPPSVVEPAIALSISWAGFLLIRKQKNHSPPYIIIFLFGLLHGLGFAGALAELGLPSSGALLALLTFNLGIELAQLCAMLICVGIMLIYARYIGDTQLLSKSIGYSVFVIGLVWALLRLVT